MSESANLFPSLFNPEWISHRIYRIFNWGSNNKRHRIYVENGSDIFNAKEDRLRFPLNKIRFLFELMRLYELAYFEHNNMKMIFVPGLLPVDQPSELPQFRVGERLVMRFTVDKALPPNITSRIIVRHHEEVKHESELWRKGAVLHRRTGDAIALIIEESRRIIVEIKGIDKTMYLNELRQTVSAIFESYKKIEPDLQYEVLIPSHDLNQNNDKPLMLSDNLIRAYSEKGMRYLDPRTYRELSLVDTADAYDVKYTPEALKAYNDFIKGFEDDE